MPYDYAKEMFRGKMGTKRYGANRIRIVKSLKRDTMTDSFTRSVSKAVAHKRDNNLPVAKYDEKSKRAYLEYSDGHKEYIEEA